MVTLQHAAPATALAAAAAAATATAGSTAAAPGAALAGPKPDRTGLPHFTLLTSSSFLCKS